MLLRELCGAGVRGVCRNGGLLALRGGGRRSRAGLLRGFSSLDEVQLLQRDIEEYKRMESLEAIMNRKQELQASLQEEDAWKDGHEASKLSQELARLNATASFFVELEQQLSDVIEMINLAQDEKDEKLVDECMSMLADMKNAVKSKKLSKLVSTESSCYMEIAAGTGGADAFHWTKMLATMYAKWAYKSGRRVEYIDEQHDESVTGLDGYRRVTLKFEGDSAYGWLEAEAGVHRLVRKSPFDPTGKRHTSFAQVLLYPVPSSDQLSFSSIQIKDSDIKVETFKSRGAGGQSVNTTDSAVRITHMATNISVSCQKERSQHQNKAIALKVLKSKLWKLNVESLEAEKKEKTIGQGSNSWGSQIRSVVLHPYNLVKDSRSGWETTDVEGHLEGDHLTDAMESYFLDYKIRSVL